MGRPKKILDTPEPISEPVTHDALVEHIVDDDLKKKRGRKKKNVENEEPKIIKKRGRKPVATYYSSSIQKEELFTESMITEAYILNLDKDIGENIGVDKLNVSAYPGNLDDSILNTYINKYIDTDIDKKINIDIETSNLKKLYEEQLVARDHDDLLTFDNLKHIDQNQMILQENNFFENLHSAPKQTSVCPNDGIYQLFKEYTDNKSWLEQTDVHCYWCCHAFGGVPLGLPLKYDINSKKFRTTGIFCSFPCLIAYNNNNKCNCMPEIQLLYKLICNNNEVLKSAPERECLKMFGGNLNIEDFRQINKIKSFQLINYPMFPRRGFIEEIDIANIKKANPHIYTKPDESNKLDFIKFS
jgi:hypothetical protein